MGVLTSQWMGSRLRKLAAAAALFPKLVSLHDLAAAAGLSPKLVSLHNFPLGCRCRLVIFLLAFDADAVIR